MMYCHPPSENTQQCTLSIIHALSDCDHNNIVDLEDSITITEGQNVDMVCGSGLYRSTQAQQCIIKLPKDLMFN